MNRHPSDLAQRGFTGSHHDEHSYPLESWPKDTKDRFLAEHKNDSLADVGTARQQPKRQSVTFTQQREGTEDHFGGAATENTAAVAEHGATVALEKASSKKGATQKIDAHGSRGAARLLSPRRQLALIGIPEYPLSLLPIGGVRHVAGHRSAAPEFDVLNGLPAGAYAVE